MDNINIKVCYHMSKHYKVGL